jgi:hypothetical protein
MKLSHDVNIVLSSRLLRCYNVYMRQGKDNVEPGELGGRALGYGLDDRDSSPNRGPP